VGDVEHRQFRIAFDARKQLEPLLLSVSTGRERSTPRVLIGTAGKETSALGAAALPIFGEFSPQFDVLLKPHL
jgi:hypothetical protein